MASGGRENERRDGGRGGSERGSHSNDPREEKHCRETSGERVEQILHYKTPLNRV